MKPIVVGLLAIALYLGFCFLAGNLVADGALHPLRRAINAQERSYAIQVAKQVGTQLQDVSLITTDGTNLRAWLIQPIHNNGNSVLLLHGMGDNRSGMIGYAELLLTSGYSVLLPDARAHGESGGELATYGLLERHDIHQWVTWIEDHLHPACVFGFGESMGAAELLQSLAVEDRFCSVADSLDE